MENRDLAQGPAAEMPQRWNGVMRWRPFVLVALLPVCLFAQPTVAEESKTLETQLGRLYEGKVLALRSFYRGNRLVYDKNGELRKGGKRGVWTVDGNIEVKEFKVRGGTLEIHGYRVLLVYDRAKQEWEYVRSKKRILMEIVGLSQPITLESVANPLGNIFFRGGEDISGHLPEYWQLFLGGNTHGLVQEEGRFRDGAAAKLLGLLGLGKDEKIFEAGPEASAPECVSCRNPDFTQAARSMRHEASLIVALIISEQGTVEGCWILEPAGMGLDDEAVQVIKAWKFKPGMRDGIPVRVISTIETSYYLYP